MGPYDPYQSSLMDQMMGGFAPVVTGRQFTPMTGMEGIPFMNQPGIPGMMMNMFVAPQLQRMMGSYGMTPMGLGHDQNIYDVMRNRQFEQSRQQAMANVTDLDRGGMMRSFRGMAAMTGTPYGVQQRRAAGAMADTASSFAPMFADMMPEFMDELGGMRGSATVMANRMMMGSRYRIDPVTGMMGQSSRTVSDQTRSIFKDFYEDGNLQDMRGITAGNLGSMYDEMTRRGMVEGRQQSLGGETRSALRDLQREDPMGLRRIAQEQGFEMPKNLTELSGEQMDKLRATPEVSAKMRGFDAERVKRSLKQYVDVVGAMKDIFGEMGQPNAPMSQLIKGLEALTQGGVGQIDPGRLNMMVRTTSEMAKQSGMSMDAALGVQQHAANRLQQLGMSPLHAVQAAQGGMAFGSAFRAQGGAAVPAWGRFNADQMMQLDTNLRAQAVSSEQANRLAVLMRARKSIGGFEKGSVAEAMSEAVLSGETEFIDPITGASRSTRMEGEDFASIMLDAKGRGGQKLGMTEGQLARMLNQRETNEQQIHEYGIGDQVRRQMSQDMRGWTAARYQESLEERLEGAGMSKDQAQKISASAAGRISDRIAGLSHSQYASDEDRTNRTAEIMREEVIAAGGSKFDSGQTEDFWQMTADQAYGHANRQVSQGRMRGFGNMQNVHATMNEETLLQAKKNTMQAKFTAQVKDALQPLGRGTLLQRGVQALQDAKPGTEFGEILSKTFGGVDNADIQKGLQKPMEEVVRVKQDLENLHRQYLNTPDGESRTRIMKEIEAKQELLNAASTKLVGVGEAHGIFIDESIVSAEDAAEGVENTRTMMLGVQDLAALRGGFGNKVTQAEQDAVVGQKFESEAIAADALYQRRRRAAETVDDSQVQEFAKANNIADLKQAKRQLQAQRVESINITDDEVTEFMDTATIEAGQEASDVVKQRRMAQKIEPTDDEVLALTGPDPTEAAVRSARATLRARNRNKRFGLGLGDDATVEQVQAAVEERMQDQLTITAEDRANYVAKDKLHYAKLDEKEIDDRILRERMDESHEQWGRFWHSESGAAHRESVERSMQGVDNLATDLIISKKQMRRLGPQALERFKALRGQQTRLAELAATYTQGDQARLIAGDFSDIEDPRMQEGLRNEVHDIISGTGDVEGMMQHQVWFRNQIGKEGRQWGDREAAARSLLGLPSDIAAPLTQQQASDLRTSMDNIGVAEQLTDEDIKDLDEMQRKHERLTTRAGDIGSNVEDLAKFFASGERPVGTPDIFFGIGAKDKEQALLARTEAAKLEDEIAAAKAAGEKPGVITAKEEQLAGLLQGFDKKAGARGLKGGQEYLDAVAGGRVATDATMQLSREAFDRQVVLRKKLGGRATAMGIGGPDEMERLQGGYDAITQLDAQQEQFARMEAEPSQELVSGLFERSGLDTSQEYKDTIARNVRIGQTGKLLARRAIGSTDMLADLAKTREGNLKGELNKDEIAALRKAGKQGKTSSAAELVDQYQEAMKGGDADVEKFFTSMGLKDKEGRDKFRDSADFMINTKLSDIDEITDSKKRAEFMADTLVRLDRGGEYAKTPQANESDQRITIKGSLDITNNPADLNATGTR